MRTRGFTLIELLVALAILALMISISAPRYFGNLDRVKEDVLREDLYVLRDAIDKFYSDRQRYPDTLEELVTERYVRKLPVDPFTQSAGTWAAVPPSDTKLGALADVRSSAKDKARDGTWVKDW